MDAAPPSAEPDRSARKTGRTSDHGGRVEIITRAEPRRSWTQAQKQEIVAESLDGDLTPSEVARKHAISSGQLYTWRQQLLGVQSALVRTAPQFAQVEVEPDPPQPTEVKSHEPPPAGLSTPARPQGLIEVVLPGGVMLRVDAHVDGRALRHILAALEGR